jgi:uncharacterized protein YcaQ
LAGRSGCAQAAPQEMVRLLTPFDPLVWDRPQRAFKRELEAKLDRMRAILGLEF